MKEKASGINRMNIYLNFITAVVMILSTVSVQGETEEPREILDYNKEYIEKLDEKIIIRPYFNAQKVEFDIQSTSNGSKKIMYRPNVPLNFGVGIYHPFLGVGISFSTKLSINEADKSKYGESDFYHFMFNYYGRNFGFDFNLFRYKGFYIDEPEKIYTTWQDGDPYPQQPGLTARGIELNLYYLFSGEKLSLAAAFDQTERQIKSKGSFMVMVSFVQVSVVSDRAIIPPSQQQFYGDLATFTEGNFGTLSLMPGYAYTLTLYNFYFTPALFLGPGIQGQTYNSKLGEKEAGGWTARLNMRASAGYHSDSFFTGIQFLLDSTTIRDNLGTMNIDARIVSLGLFFGMKF